MKRHFVIFAALVCASSFVARPARADAAPSTLTPIAADERTLVDSGAGAATYATPASTLDALREFGARPITLDAVAYRPRSRFYSSRSHSPWYGSETQFHAGFFDPQGDAAQGFVLGVRGGPLMDPRVQIGVGVDWEHRGDQQSQVVGTSGGPGGTTITTRRQLSSSSENTFPLMAIVQLSGDDSKPLVPYGGVGAGYEVVTLSANDFSTGSSFDATYGGWGWQGWLGLKYPLSGRSGVVAEVFTNRAEAARDVFDATLGQTFHETVNLNGFGMRFGLTWGI